MEHIYLVTHVFQVEKVDRERREVIDPNMLAKNRSVWIVLSVKEERRLSK